MSQAIEFLTAHWIIGIIVGIVVIFVIGALVRTAIKLAVVALIIGVILVFVIGLSPSAVLDKGKAAVDGTTSLYNKTIEPKLEKEIDNADINVKPNGDYVIQASTVKIVGKKGDKNITVYYKDKSYKIDASLLGDKIQQKIDDYKADSNA